MIQKPLLIKKRCQGQWCGSKKTNIISQHWNVMCMQRLIMWDLSWLPNDSVPLKCSSGHDCCHFSMNCSTVDLVLNLASHLHLCITITLKHLPVSLRNCLENHRRCQTWQNNSKAMSLIKLCKCWAQEGSLILQNLTSPKYYGQLLFQKRYYDLMWHILPTY